QLLSGQLDTDGADPQWPIAATRRDGCGHLELRRHRRHADPVVHRRPQESSGASDRLPVCGSPAHRTPGSRHRIARQFKIPAGVRRWPADHRRARRHPGTVRALVSGLGLCNGRRVIRRVRPAGIHPGAAGRGLSHCGKTGLEPAFSVGGHSRRCGRDRHDGAGRDRTETREAAENRYMTTSNERDRASPLLAEHQRLATSGARGVLVFHTGTELHLAIPQLAVDIPGTPPYMNGGNSDVDMMLYRWSGGRFIEDGRLPVPGGEDAVYFQIGDAEFLATASVRTGSGPYDLNADSVLYRRAGGGWEVFQRFPSFAAKQWHYFAIGSRHFLALAQGVTLDGAVARNPRRSCLFEWDGHQFIDFQTLEGGWGYNWVFFDIDGQSFLGYADHTGPSGLMIWNGRSFAPFQEFAPQGGRAYQFFRADGQAWLAFA